MQSQTSSSRNQKESPTYWLEFLLFSEKIWIRWIRIGCVLLIIFGWGIAGSLIFESDREGVTKLNVARYALAPLAAMLGALFLGARYLQDVYELPSYSSALRYLTASMFDGPPSDIFLLSGKLLPSLNISNGDIDTVDGDINLLQRIGGPGWISVERGNVVLLEYLHSPAKVLGPGIHFIPRLQHIGEIFNLEDQHWEAPPIVATTKDGIEVAVHDFQFGYRLASPPHGTVVTKRTTKDPYPFSAKSVWKLAYHRNVSSDGKPVNWGRWVQSTLDGKITGYINKKSIDEIIAPTSGYTHEAVQNAVSSSEVRQEIIDKLGTEVTWLNIGRFDINDQEIGREIKDYRLEAWFAQWAGKASLIRAEGKAEQISQTEGGRIEKTTSMLRGILQALEEVNLEGDVDDHVWNIVLARTAQIIEALTSQYEIELLGLDSVDSKKGAS